MGTAGYEPRLRRRVRAVCVGACVGLCLLAAAWVGSSAAAPSSSAGAADAQARGKGGSVIVSTRKVKGLGVVLVDGSGRTLYMFVPDKRKRVTCTGTCAAVWPPLKLPAGKKPKARGKARASLLGSDKDPAGGRVVTYKGWPLYLYVADRKPGDATGQALDLNGGLWYVLSPSGKVIRVKARHTSSGRGY